MAQIIDKISSNLADNPYFGAGFGLASLGVGLTLAKRGVSFGLIIFKRYRMVSLEVTHRDLNYLILLNWVRQQQTGLRHTSLVSRVHQSDSGQISYQEDFVPNVGTHFFKFNGHWIKLERDRQQSPLDTNTGLPMETLKFTSLASPDLFPRMVEVARNLELSKHVGKTTIFKPRTSDWAPFGEPQCKREYDSVILDGNTAEEILDDVNEFLRSRDFYRKIGVFHRRSYLLYGPPGGGKTSYILALAGALDYDICQLNMSNSALSDDRLDHLFNVAPPNSIILLEDIDRAFTKQGPDLSGSAYQGLGRITLSGVQNVFDGASFAKSRIVFMTCNDLSTLDPVLTRPGRIDRKFYIGYASNAQICRAYEKFFTPGEMVGPSSQTFIEALEASKKRSRPGPNRKEKISMADLYSHLFIHRKDPQRAIDRIDDLFLIPTNGN